MSHTGTGDEVGNNFFFIFFYFLLPVYLFIYFFFEYGIRSMWVPVERFRAIFSSFFFFCFDNCETERCVVFCCVSGSGPKNQQKAGVIPTVVVPAGPRGAVPTVRAGVPARIPAYTTPGVYSQVRANPNGFGGAVRQDKSHYRYNPVGPANAGYNVGGGYY